MQLALWLDAADLRHKKIRNPRRLGALVGREDAEEVQKT